MTKALAIILVVLPHLLFVIWAYKKVYPRGMFADIPEDIEFLKAVRRGEVDFNPPLKIEIENAQGRKREYNPDDYWGEEVDYATGEIVTDTGPAIRHPKNRDRAYESSP